MSITAWVRVGRAVLRWLAVVAVVRVRGRVGIVGIPRGHGGGSGRDRNHRGDGGQRQDVDAGHRDCGAVSQRVAIFFAVAIVAVTIVAVAIVVVAVASIAVAVTAAVCV